MFRILRSHDFRVWLAVMGSATLIIGVAYALTQQSTRLSANDLPIANGEVVKSQLESGQNPTDIVSKRLVNLRSDSNVFVIVTDNTRHVLASSADLDGQTPLPPEGVFDYTTKHGSDHFTWAPENGVRLATSVTTYGKDLDSGYIITGQSLKPAEDRVGIYTELALAAWAATLAWTTLTLLLPSKPLRK